MITSRKTKKFTILHLNDMHGDFLAEVKEGKTELIGGLALLSGYINKVRKEEENVIFVIAGDMVQGSLIDSEYKGISTIEIMNYLAPDVVALGNHEFDYGLPHLLFLEKMANFPIVNANLYIKKYYKRLMQPFYIKKMAGMDILFTGIITEKIMDALSQDKLIGSFVTLEEASKEVGKITNAYKKDDIDLTILLTHIGLDSDIQLAKMLKPEWGVDLIIGGHSHSYLKEPVKENNILIAQAGVGTDQVGRFDIVVNDDTNSIIEYQWKTVDINEKNAKPDLELLKYIERYKKIVDQKYNTQITKSNKKLIHPKREISTSLGNLIADIFAQASECDVMLVGSGSIRIKEMGPVITLGDLMACFPYDDVLVRYSITGRYLKKIFSHILRPENRTGEGECYQINKEVLVIYDEKLKKIISFKIREEEISDEKLYKICMQGYHANNAKAYLNLSDEELRESKDYKVVSTSGQDILEEYFRNYQNIIGDFKERLIFK